MLHLYFGLLLVGMAASAHASQENGGKVLIPETDQTTTRFVSSGTDFPFSYKPGESCVVLDRTAVAATAGVAQGGLGSGSPSALLQISQPEKETAPATTARWGKYDGGSRILSLARHKRVEFNAEQFKVTLRQDSALIEAGHLKVGLRSGATSMVWVKAL